MSEEQAKQIVDAIIDNLTGRKGLDHEWEAIDEDIQAEIREEWVQIVMKCGE